MSSHLKAIGKALTNKVGGVMAAPKVKYHESKSRKANERYGITKDYQAKKMSGALDSKTQAQYEGVKSYYSK